MLTNTLVLFVLVVALVAVGTLIVYFWMKDPFKAALGSTLSSLAVLVGTLGLPDVKGTFRVNVDLRFVNFTSDALQVMVGTPPVLWAVAFISIVVLAGLVAVLLHLENKDRRKPNQAVKTGLGDDVF